MFLKNIIVASHQFQGSEAESDQKCLLKSMQELCDVLANAGEQHLRLLSGDNPDSFVRGIQLCEECVTSLLALLRRRKPDSAALHHGAVLLLSLMAQNQQTRCVMQRNNDIVQVLTQTLTEGACDSGSIAHRVLEILRLLTNNKKMTRDPYLQDLLLFLLRSIEVNKDVAMLRSSIGVLANLCRHDRLGTQMQLRALNCGKALGKALVPNLSHKDQNIIVFTLAVIANLGMEDDLGKMLFHAKNLSQTMQLIFNVIVKGSSELALSSCVDLMRDLLNHEHIQNFLVSYENLTPFLLQLFKLLASCESWMGIQIVHFLLALTSVPALRVVLGQVAIRQEVAKNLLSTLLLTATKQNQHADSGHIRGSCGAMHLLRDLLEYLVPREDGHSSSSVNPETEATLQCAISCVKEALAASESSEEHLTKLIEALLLLKSLALRAAVRQSNAAKEAATCIAQLLERQVKAATSKCLGHSKVSSLSAYTSETERAAYTDDEHVDVVLHSLKLLTILGLDCQDVSCILNPVLQDSQVAATLALGVMSESKDRVLLALDVLASAGNKGICLPLLSDLIATRNGQRVLESWYGDGLQPHQTTLPIGQFNGSISSGALSATSSTLAGSGQRWLPERKDHISGLDQDPTLRSLVTKMESGLEIKDLRTSEILGIYEHKLRAAQTKEEHLQDLFDAKALALSQADRLIQQYRTRMSQSEVEAQKLRSFLQEAEKRCEEGGEQLREMLLDRERLQTELERQHGERTGLELQCAEWARRHEASQRAGAALKQEHDTLREMHEALQKYSESLKEQHRALEKEYQQLEANHTKTVQQLKDKEAKLADTVKLKQKQEEMVSQLCKEKADLAQVIESLQEKERQLNKKVASLTEACKNSENVIREKEEIIREQRCQLDKTGQMMSLINQITSGGRLPDQQQVHAK